MREDHLSMEVPKGQGWCLYDPWLCLVPSPLPCTLSGQLTPINWRSKCGNGLFLSRKPREVTGCNTHTPGKWFWKERHWDTFQRYGSEAEFWTLPRCVEQETSFPRGVLEKEVEFLKRKDRKGEWYLRLRMRPSRRQGFDNLRMREAGVSRRGVEATSVKFCSDPCRSNKNHISMSFSGLSPLLFQSPDYPRPDWNALKWII